MNRFRNIYNKLPSALQSRQGQGIAKVWDECRPKISWNPIREV